MRLAWYSNDPLAGTGYGVQTASVCRRLQRDGHEVHILANYGQQCGVRDWEGCAVWPQGVVQYSLDTVAEQATMAGAEVVFTLYDVWVLGETWPDHRVVSWTPIDHYPPPPEVLKWARRHETIAMSEFGANALREAGVEVIATIPHTIEAEYHPNGPSARAKMKVPDDAFAVGIFAANIGVTPPRKNWGGHLEAVARMMHAHDDVYLYLHTDLARPGGLSIPVLIAALGIPKERVVVVPPTLYRGGFIDTAEMAKLYRAMDVTLLATKGEGFGIPALESMGCGTPAIVSDFSAQPEIVGDTGWKVPGQLDWDHNQGSWFFTPFTMRIVDALEAAYAEKGTEAAKVRREAAAKRAELYRADRIHEEQWRPLMERLAADSKPRPGKSNAAKRRQKKAKAKEAA